MRHSTNRARILCHLKDMDGTATAREIAEALDLPVKSVQDALTVLHHMERVTRIGRKFSARWSSYRPPLPPTGWNTLSATWFGRDVDVERQTNLPRPDCRRLASAQPPGAASDRARCANPTSGQ